MKKSIAFLTISGLVTTGCAEIHAHRNAHTADQHRNEAHQPARQYAPPQHSTRESQRYRNSLHRSDNEEKQRKEKRETVKQEREESD